MRASGILMPVFSLPGPFGIGALGKEPLHSWIFCRCKADLLADPAHRPHRYGDSPYQSFSAFAGNPTSLTTACWPTSSADGR